MQAVLKHKDACTYIDLNQIYKKVKFSNDFILEYFSEHHLMGFTHKQLSLEQDH